MKPISTFCIAVIVNLFFSCQKEEFIAPGNSTDQGILAKVFCGNLSTGNMLCEQEASIKGSITLGNCKNAIYLEVKSPEKFTKARISIKVIENDEQHPTMYKFNFVHADPVNNNVYALKNIYQPGENVLVMVELDGTIKNHSFKTAPFITHQIQGCN